MFGTRPRFYDKYDITGGPIQFQWQIFPRHTSIQREREILTFMELPSHEEFLKDELYIFCVHVRRHPQLQQERRRTMSRNCQRYRMSRQYQRYRSLPAQCNLDKANGASVDWVLKHIVQRWLEKNEHGAALR